MGLQTFSSSVLFAVLCVINCNAWTQEDVTPTQTAMDVMRQVYVECLQDGSVTCLKPRFLSFLKKSISQNKIRITRDLTIIQREDAVPAFSLRQDEEVESSGNTKLIERIENFLGTHDLRMRLPREILSGDIVNYVPQLLLKNIPEEIRMPLASPAPVAQERGFIKKVVIPFILGLKFKFTALLPLALGLIALKTWKALTLGLLSLVLSGAMVIFKFTKPKVNYEFIHYAQHAHPIIEHANYDHYHHGHHGRSLPYRGHDQPEE